MTILENISGEADEHDWGILMGSCSIILPFSKESKFVENLASLPEVALTKVLGYLSPRDFLSLAKLSQRLKSSLENCCKRARRVHLDDLKIDEWNYNKPLNVRNVEIPLDMPVSLFPDDLHYDQLPPEDIKWLLKNLSAAEINPGSSKYTIKGLRAKCILSDGECPEEIPKHLRQYRATQLHFTAAAQFSSSFHLKDLFNQAEVTRLTHVVLHVTPEMFALFSCVKTESIRCTVERSESTVNESFDEIKEYLETIVQEWNADKRSIKAYLFRFRLDYYYSLCQNSLENLAEIPLKIAEKYKGGFDKGIVNEHIALIKRHDGRGLLIGSLGGTMFCIECDYAYRSKAGFGSQTICIEILSRMRKIYMDLKDKWQELTPSELKSKRSRKQMDEFEKNVENKIAALREELYDVNKVCTSTLEHNIDLLFLYDQVNVNNFWLILTDYRFPLHKTTYRLETSNQYVCDVKQLEEAIYSNWRRSHPITTE